MGRLVALSVVHTGQAIVEHAEPRLLNDTLRILLESSGRNYVETLGSRS